MTARTLSPRTSAGDLEKESAVDAAGKGDEHPAHRPQILLGGFRASSGPLAGAEAVFFELTTVFLSSTIFRTSSSRAGTISDAGTRRRSVPPLNRTPASRPQATPMSASLASPGPLTMQPMIGDRERARGRTPGLSRPRRRCPASRRPRTGRRSGRRRCSDRGGGVPRPARIR